MGGGGQEEQTCNYRKVTHGVIMCSMATIANNTIIYFFYFVHLKVPKSVDLKRLHHTHESCSYERLWTRDGLIMVIISEYIQIRNLYVEHTKLI